ncbi:hypothetical protein [Pyxidicoccus trucidator]|uniref:hypothetical protein n=1 Tax=Pyxidicoccus trucidator TaxID=2709662 RepID=UPI0013D9AB1E|nr:hypothetical protein [Pyxidicoccus trucidator]
MRGAIVDFEFERCYVSVKNLDLPKADVCQLFSGEIRISKPKKESGAKAKGNAKAKIKRKDSNSQELLETAIGEGKLDADDDGRFFQVDSLKLYEKNEFEFACDEDNVVTWIGPLGSTPPEPTIPEVLRQYITTDEYSEFEKLDSVETCRLNDVVWKCPVCDRLNLFTPKREPCANPHCDKPFPEGDAFKHSWVLDGNTRVLTFLSKCWECPKCLIRNLWSEGGGTKCGNISCSFTRPSKGSVEWQCHINHAEYLWTYEETGLTVTSLGECLKSEKSAEHHSVEEIIEQGDCGFEKALDLYKDKSCPHCALLGSGEPKGCQHSSVSQLACMRFSEWYGLTEGDYRHETRYRQLASLLSGIPRCMCKDSYDDMIGAVPKPPHNVFRKLIGNIDPNHSYWNKVSDIVTEKRPKLKVFEVITNVNPSMKCHIVPRSAGGCFINIRNVIWIQHLCPVCQCLDALFTEWQGENETYDKDQYQKRFVLSEEQLKNLVGKKIISDYMKSRTEIAEKIESLCAKFRK